VTDDSGRDPRGRFAPGNPGGPGGPRRRASELRKAAEDAITPEHVQAMIRKATRMGLEGNLAAMRLVFERTSGRAPEAPMETEPLGVALPRLRTAEDCNVAIERLVDGICKGTVDRDTARLLIDAIQARLRILEVTDIERRLADMEKTAASLADGRSFTPPDPRFE
jgi:hypothetical protein